MLDMDLPQCKNRGQLRVLGLPTVASFTDPSEIVRSNPDEPADNRVRYFGQSDPRPFDPRNKVGADLLLYSGKIAVT